MQINNGKDGELLWRFYKQMNEDVMTSKCSDGKNDEESR
jgi:hypothetical protein